MFHRFADSEHHGGGSAHAELMRGAMHQQPVFGETLQARDAVANLVVENFRAATGDGIKSGIAEPNNRVAYAERTVFGNRQNLRRGIAVQMNFREALLDSAEHPLMPFDFEIGMKAALHQYPGAA